MASSESFPEVDWSCEHKDSAEKWRHLLQSEGILGNWEPFWQVRSFLECFLLKIGETLCKMEVSLIKGKKFLQFLCNIPFLQCGEDFLIVERHSIK